MGLCGPPGPVWRWWQLPMVALCLVGEYTFCSYPMSLYYSGGAWYILVLVLLMLVIAVPIMFVQIRLGATTRRDVVSLLSKYIPGLQGVGAALLAQLFILALCVGIFLTYLLYYMLHAMASQGGQHYEWSRCDNWWNTKSCCLPESTCTSTENLTSSYQYIKPTTAEEEYFTNVVLERDGSWMHIGSVVPHLVWPLFLVWLFIFALVVGGPRAFPWIVGVVGGLGVLVVCMLLGYVFHSLAPDAAREGVKRIFEPHEISTIWQIDVVPRALTTDVFMFTALVMGILPTYGKFCGRGRTLSALAWLPILLVMILLPNIIAITMCAYYGAMAEKMPKENTESIVISFLSHPIVGFSQMASRLEMSAFWGSMIFVPVFFFGAIFQGLVAIVITDSILNGIHIGRLRYMIPKVGMRAILAVIYCSVAFLLSLPLVTHGGWYLYQEVNLSLFLLEIFYFVLYAIALLVCYGRAIHLDILEKVIVMTLFFLASILYGAGIIWSHWDDMHYVLGYSVWFVMDSTRILFRVAVAIGPLLLCGIIGLIHALCVAPSGCERRMAYTFGGDRFDDVPVEEDEIGQEEVAIPLEVEPEEKDPNFLDVNPENYEEPEIIPLYPSPPPNNKHHIGVEV